MGTQMNKAFALIGAIIIIVLFAALGTFGASMLSTDVNIARDTVESTRAFYIAEAGIQDVLYRLSTNSTFRNASSSLVNGSMNISGGTYNYFVSVVRNGSSYNINSIGNITNIDQAAIRRAINQTVRVTLFPAYAMAVFGNNASFNLSLQDSASISGDIYVNGDTYVEAGAGVSDGLVYADNVTGPGTYNASAGPPSPVPTYPSLNTSWYDSELATAVGSSSGNLVLNGSSNLNLAGGTFYYDDVEIKDTATITGPGAIVATGRVELKDNTIVYSNVTIIANEEIEVKNSAVVQGEAVIYSNDEIELKDFTNVTGSLIGDEVEVEHNTIMTGIILADEVELEDSVTIRGSLVTKEVDDNGPKDSVSIIYNASFLPSSTPPGLEGGTVTIQSWKEVN